MANPESFVSPRRGGGTGAAAILQPSTALKDIFTTYDAQRKQPDDPFLDSLGADIKKGADGFVGIYELDRPAIAKARDELTNLQAKAFMAKTSYATHPEVYQAIDNKKQELIDLVSKSQRTRAIDEKTTTEFQNNGYKYDDAQKKNYQEWRTQPIETRSAVPDIRPLDSANYQAIAKKWGAKNQQGYYSIANYKDQSGVTRSGYVFNENLARDNWNQLVKSEAGTQDMQRWFGHATEVAKDQFEKDGVKWDEVPEEVRLKAIDAEAEDMYVESMRMQTPSSDKKSYSVKTDEKKTAASDNAKKSSAGYRIEFEPAGGTLRRTEVIPIIGSPLVTEKSDEWIGGSGELVIGKPFSIRKPEGATSDKAILVISKPASAGRSAKFVEVPYNKNDQNLKIRYGVGIESKPTNWKSLYENAVPSATPNQPSMTPEELRAYMSKWTPAWNKYTSERKGKAKSTAKKDRVAPPNEM